MNIRERRQSNTERGKFGIGGRQSGTAVAVRECDLFVLGLEQFHSIYTRVQGSDDFVKTEPKETHEINCHAFRSQAKILLTIKNFVPLSGAQEHL